MVHQTSQFRIPNSEFRIPNSEFRIPNSDNSEFRISKKKFNGIFVLVDVTLGSVLDQLAYLIPLYFGNSCHSITA